MSYESAPGLGPEDDPTTYWIHFIRRSMDGSAASEGPPARPPLVMDVEHQAMLAMDPEHTDENITDVVFEANGECTIETTKHDELGPEKTYLTFIAYGPPPQVGGKARLYRSKSRLPRGLVLLSGEPGDEIQEHVQFYETPTEYEKTITDREIRRRTAMQDRQQNLEERFERLPDGLKARLEGILRAKPEGSVNLQQEVLCAEQAAALATHIPDAEQLTGLRRRSLQAQLAALAPHINTEGWDKDRTAKILDMAIFYLETQEEY